MQETGNKSNNPYSLSIRFYTDGFSFFICNPQSDKNFTRADYPVTDSTLLIPTLTKALEEYEPLKERKYTIVSALFYGPVSHVPLEMFNKEQRQTLYELTCPQLPDSNIHYNILPHLEVADLFAIPKETERLLLEHFPTIHFYAQNSMVLERSVQQAAGEQVPTLYAYFYAGYMLLFRYRQKRILFANEFRITAVKDALYYILNVWKSLEMEAQTDACVLIQPENGPEQLPAELARYIRDVRTANLTEWFQRAPLARIKGIPFDILSLLLNGF